MTGVQTCALPIWKAAEDHEPVGVLARRFDTEFVRVGIPRRVRCEHRGIDTGGRAAGHRPRIEEEEFDVEHQKGDRHQMEPDVEAPPRVVPRTTIRTKDLEQSHVCLGTAGYRQDHDDRYASYVLNTVLGGSMSSRLFQDVREKRGLAYAVFKIGRAHV